MWSRPLHAVQDGNEIRVAFTSIKQFQVSKEGSAKKVSSIFPSWPSAAVNVRAFALKEGKQLALIRFAQSERVTGLTVDLLLRFMDLKTSPVPLENRR